MAAEDRFLHSGERALSAEKICALKLPCEGTGGLMQRFVLPGLLAATLVLGIDPATAQDITIGVAGPITGSNAVFGEQMKRGAEMAVADVNAKGGVLGKK